MTLPLIAYIKAKKNQLNSGRILLLTSPLMGDPFTYAGPRSVRKRRLLFWWERFDPLNLDPVSCRVSTGC